MNMLGMKTQKVIGMRSARNIFSDNGTLLIPMFSTITRRHLRLLALHGIRLRLEDLIPPDVHLVDQPIAPVPVDDTIDEAVEQVSEIFNEISEQKVVPIVKLRQNVIPMIIEATQSGNMLELIVSLQALDDYTYRHNVAVAALANLIGQWLKLDQQALLQLTTSALLHDVGKMLIPKNILNKPEKLTNEEFQIMKHHTILGYELLKRTVGVSHRQALVALQHHERMDGSGYPLGLKRDKIDPFSRIVAVADVFHAMTSARVYRSPSPFYKVLEQMEQDAFGVLDPIITNLFIEKIMNSLIGHCVKLTDGSEGMIVMIQQHRLTRPLIKRRDQFIDLSEQSSLHIEQIF